MENSISDTYNAVLYAHNDWCGLGPIESCNSAPNVAVMDAKTTDEGWNPYRLFFLVLRTLLCVLKPTDEVWDPYKLVSLDLKTLFYMQKLQMRAGTRRD